MIDQALTFISIDWLKSLAAKLKKIRDERAGDIQKIGDIFGDPRLLARYYVQPTCQHHNPADRDEDDAPVAQVKMPIFEFINNFLNKEIDDSVRDGRTQQFILADAGMGKTSLLVMLKLAHVLAFWPKGYECLLLKLGPDTLSVLRGQGNRAKTILLLDALDEDPTAWGRFDDRLLELLMETQNFRRVLITCRTQFFPETGADPFGNPGRVTVGGFICPMVFLSPFDDPQVGVYLRKRFPDPWDHWLTGRENESRRRAQQLLQSMRSLRSRPLLLAYIDNLLEVRESAWNEYTTYDALIEAWLLREVRKLAEQGVKPVPSKDVLWAACTAVAVHMQSQGQRLLSQPDLQELIAAMPVIRAIERFDFGGRSLMNRTSDHVYRFSHYSIQEFLVVHAVVEGSLDGVRAARPTATPPLKMRATAQMLDFLRRRSAEGVRLDYLDRLDISGIKADQLVSLPGWDCLKDGGSGPVMVVIPAGEFVMGSPENEHKRDGNEGPQHKVVIAKPFAMGRYAVTFEEYDRFCEATGREKPGDEGWGRGRRPVVNVTWHDAVAYCAWLSEQTGAVYRLPSEAEWEYACRAGTTTAFWWGDEIDATRANYDGTVAYRNEPTGEYRRQTIPVDTFQPNPFGLYQVHGNVWEWVQDCFHETYDGAPDDGSAWEEENCSIRVLRGGSWHFEPFWLRGAARDWNYPHDRFYNRGFRLARTFP